MHETLYDTKEKSVKGQLQGIAHLCDHQVHLSLIMHPARPKAGHRRRRWTARPGGGHSILGLPQDLHILGPENENNF